jgi:hypothetical protein
MEVPVTQAFRLILSCALLASSPALAAKATSLSWGKPGVSFDQYRQDAVECGRSGYYLDVSGTDAAHRLQLASRRLETSEAGFQAANPVPTLSAYSRILLRTSLSSGEIAAGGRAERGMEDVRALLQGTVDGCLIERGYVPFRLNAAQTMRLRRLHAGSAERHAYLYGLASDPRVISDQAVAFVLADAPPP